MESIVYNKDCMAGMAEYPDNYFDLAVVDPPYGLSISSNKKMSSSSKKEYQIKEIGRAHV